MATKKIFAALVLASAVSATVPAMAGTTGTQATISLSGSTAIRNWLISPEFTSIPGGATVNYSNGTYLGGASGLSLRNSVSYTGVQLGTTANATGLRVEWHEQGSAEGILELANDQIGYFGGSPINDSVVPRYQTSANPIRINGNSFGTGVTTAGGYSLANLSAAQYDTYSTVTYSSGGTNLLGGQNRVQLALSDVKPSQAFAVSTTGSYTFAVRPQVAGYGKGNPALASASTVSGTGKAGKRQQLQDQTVLNMENTKINPATAAAYATGAWNTAGINNLNTTTAVITATTFAANPGTGLTNLNKTDAQFLQIAGRLANGADFNMTTRDVNSGTRNTAANNTGVDPSWAAGENDSGNGNDGTAQAQTTLGSALRFSGKTAGGGQLRPTLQNARMAIGTLSLSDVLGNARNNSSANPLRALGYSDSSYNSSFADGSFNAITPSASSITDGTYVIWQQEQLVTVKDPTSTTTYNAAAIKGDTLGDVQTLKNTISNSVTNFPNTFSTNNPADGALRTSFILPQFMIVAKDTDGGAVTSQSSDLHDAFIGSVYASNFTTFSPSGITAGSGSRYGVAAGPSGNTALGTSLIYITAQSSSGANSTAANAPKGNYLFGNFNQNGLRDFSALKTALTAQSALFAAGGATYIDGASSVNNSVVPTGLPLPLSTMNGQVGTGTANFNGGAGASKGDLIVMGDFNGDGKFDGMDLKLFAKGAAVADSVGGDTLSLQGGEADFGTALRRSVLVKNAALDYLNINATAQQKLDATASATNDPTGMNAFNKRDVNSDGLVNLEDAFVVDKFSGQDYTSIGDQSAATIDASGSFVSGSSPVMFNLTSAKLVDTAPTDVAGRVVGSADMTVMNQGLAGTFSYAWTNIVKPGNLAIVAAPTAGTLTVPSNTTFTINAGSFTAGGTVDSLTDGNTGVSLNVVNNAGFSVAGSGIKKVGSLTGTGDTLVAPGGTLQAPAIVQSSLTVAGVNGLNSNVIISGDSTVSVVNALTIGNDAGAIGSRTFYGKIDMGNSDMIVRGGSLADVTEAARVGQVGDSVTLFSGNGITSSVAQADATGLLRYAVGVVKNDIDGSTIYDTFDGVSVGLNDVLVKFTYFGDADLNGIVDDSDFFLINNGYGNTLTGWVNGDFDYSGVIDDSDFFLINNAYGSQGAGLRAGGSVPEPTSMGVIALGAGALPGRRRRA